MEWHEPAPLLGVLGRAGTGCHWRKGRAMKRTWLLAGGALFFLAAALFYRTATASVEDALHGLHPPGSVAFLDMASVPVPQGGHLVWYTRQGHLHTAWVVPKITGWTVRAWREVPPAHPTDITWTAWSPAGSWGAILGRAPSHIAAVYVNGQGASLDRSTGLWWSLSSEPFGLETELVALNGSGTVQWRYPLVPQRRGDTDYLRPGASGESAPVHLPG